MSRGKNLANSLKISPRGANGLPKTENLGVSLPVKKELQQLIDGILNGKQAKHPVIKIASNDELIRLENTCQMICQDKKMLLINTKDAITGGNEQLFKLHLAGQFNRFFQTMAKSQENKNALGASLLTSIAPYDTANIVQNAFSPDILKLMTNQSDKPDKLRSLVHATDKDALQGILILVPRPTSCSKDILRNLSQALRQTYMLKLPITWLFAPEDYSDFTNIFQQFDDNIDLFYRKIG